MAETIDYHSLRQQTQVDPNSRLAEWALIEAIAQIKDGDQRLCNFDPKAIKVDLKINGIPVSFLKLLSEIDGQLDGMIKKAAMELFDEKLVKFEAACNTSSDRLTKLIKDATNKAREEIGLPAEKEDERY